MEENKISHKVPIISTKIEPISYELDYFVNAMPGFGKQNIKDLLDLNLTQLRTLLAITSIAKDNLVDMDKYEQEVLDLTGYKSVKNSLTALVKKQILIKSKVQKLYLIDASYFMIGNAKRIQELHKSFKNDRDPRKVQEEQEKRERPDWQMKVLEANIEQKRNSKKNINVETEAKERFGDS